ncbi:DJ-1/PfpI family protein [Anaerococcus sp. AGMB00486]|uniref:DJ-1/PfpI family protein n=2 Tax=Anaerococcus TaxID=165779 RepID=A0ABX2NAN2_9FIRM|nr:MULTISPECIES: DJ-1 family glyoxalase III [Anaerococcus]MDY3006906.1 DJ-1 family glyoxalase III [Anaerococcus porci]MSS78514.1 DJ-1/PfpI family protein [Anaerococcus porci]NVF11762.1 DJ-1/PfpI family protein [Anaerococcus faecalis]
MEKVLVFLADGCEEVEALTVVDYLRRADIKVDTASIKDDLNVCGSHDIIIKADKRIDEINNDEYSAIYIPGGTKAAERLRDDDRVIEVVKNFENTGKIISAICAGPIVLDRAGVLKNKKCVSFPSIEDELKDIGEYKKDELVVEDGNVLTSRGAATTIYLALKLVEKIKGEEAKENLKPTIQQNFVEKYFEFKY